MAIWALVILIVYTISPNIFWLVTASELKNNASLQIENTKLDISSTAIEDEGGGLQSSSGGLLKGKVLTEVKIHPNGSAMSLGNKHWDNIVADLLGKKSYSNASTKDSTKMPADEVVTVINERFSCIKCDDFDCHERSYCYNAVQCVQARRRDSTGTETYSRGCIMKLDQIVFICASSFHKQVEGFAIKCCRGNLCNDEEYPVLPHPSAGPSADNNTLELLKLAIYVIVGTFLFVGTFISIIYFLMTRCFLKQKNKYIKGFSQRSALNPFANMYRDGNKFGSIEDSTSRGILNESVSSGSGSGLPLFVQRTLAKNIYLEDIIGKGRYGEVWKGLWHGETVAVKIFFTRDEASWSRETEVFSTALLRHENILGFYGSDKTCRASCTQLWLVTHYHPNGSLCHYLQSHVLDHQELFNICLTIINGLLHLHTEIMGTQGKPAIAHRDLNSNNILVKEDGTCCISDFGLAVVRTPGTGEVNIGTSDRSGTRRYMSPEILAGIMDVEVFENFRKADIYAVALVLWEACRRCLCNGIAEDYSRPFGNVLPSEPSYEEMQKLVCVHATRPSIPNRWKDDKVLSCMERILSECWHQNPNVRLTALRIKKNLLKISNEELSHKIV